MYLNYGRVEDYITFQNYTSINITGKIVLARYGKIFRGDKVSWMILNLVVIFCQETLLAFFRTYMCLRASEFIHNSYIFHQIGLKFM